MNINIDEYLSFEEKQQIAREAFRGVAFTKCQKDFERILSNASYELVAEEVNKVFDGDMVSVVKEKAVAIINNMSNYNVFKAPDAWDKEASVGWKHLQAVVADAKPLINTRVEEIIAGLDEGYIRSMLEDLLVGVIVDKLQAK